LKPWSTFAQVAGTAAASLIGLLFVAVSIRIDFIARSQELRNRAAQTLSLFGTVLLTATLIAIPGQATEALGAELTALAVMLVVACSSWTAARRPTRVRRRSGRLSR